MVFIKKKVLYSLSLSQKEKGWINSSYKLCSTTSYSAVMVLVSLVPRPDFSHLLENCVWSTTYSIFIQVGQNAGTLFISSLTPDIIENCIPHCVQTIYQHYGQPQLPQIIDQAILSFKRSMTRLSCLLEHFLNPQSMQLTWHHDEYWNQNSIASSTDQSIFPLSEKQSGLEIIDANHHILSFYLLLQLQKKYFKRIIKHTASEWNTICESHTTAYIAVVCKLTLMGARLCKL